MAGKTLAHLLLRLGADSKEFRTALTRGEKRMKQFSRKSKEFGNAMTIGVTVPSILAGGKIIEMGMDAIEGQNLVKESFEGMTEASTKWAEELAKSLGLNKFVIQENAAMMHTMLQSMGLAEDQAYDMATSLVELAGDMESFYNLPHGDAWDKLRSGISGEAEPLKRLGILINENTIKQTAYRTGIAKLGQALTEQQKVQARYVTIMEATSKAQGDLARTINDPKNQLRALRNEAVQVATELGISLMPMVQDLIPMVRSAGEAIKVWAEAFQRLTPENKKLVVQMMALLVAAGPMIRVFSSVAGVGAGMAKTLRSASTAAGRLRKTQVAATAAAGSWSSAQRLTGERLRIANGQAKAMNASLVILAATMGVTIGTIIKPYVQEWLELDKVFGLVADSQEDFIEQMLSDDVAWAQQIDTYNKARGAFGLLGDEWKVGGEQNRTNALILHDMLPKMAAHAKTLRAQAAAQREANTEGVSAAEISRQIKRALATQDGAIDSVTRSTREMYNVMNQKDAEEQMKKLVTDFQLLAKDGVSADQLMEAFGPKVKALAEAAGGYTNLNMPSEFDQLRFSLEKGKGMLTLFADTMAQQIPDGAAAAKASLEGSIGSAMTNAKGEVEKGTAEIHEILTKMADQEYEIDVKANLDTGDFKRQLDEAGMQPDGPGVTP